MKIEMTPEQFGRYMVAIQVLSRQLSDDLTAMQQQVTPKVPPGLRTGPATPPAASGGCGCGTKKEGGSV